MRLNNGWLVSALVLVGACSSADSITEDDGDFRSSASALSGDDNDGCDADDNHCKVDAQIIATGIPGAGAVIQVGQFRRSSPFHDVPARAAFAAPGAVLDPARLLITSTSNFGAALGRPDQYAGTVLSIDPNSGSPVAVPQNFAAAGGQASALGGLVQVYSDNGPNNLNTTNPAAATANEVAAALPTGISINSGNGRPWFSNAPNGANGNGTITVIDQDGRPLVGGPDPVAGGVFTGTVTNRNPAAPHGLTAGTLGTAIIQKSSDGTGKAVFAAVGADGSVTQVHVQKGVDEMVPAGTIHPITTVTPAAQNSNNKNTVARIGTVFNWVPNRVLYVADPLNNQVKAFDVTDDGTLFHTTTRDLTGARPHLNIPIDLAPTVPEGASENFASNTTLAGGADLYVLNRGNNTVVRVSQDGKKVAKRKILVAGHKKDFTVNGIGVSPDGRNVWVSGQIAGGDGIVVRIDGFGAESDIMPNLMAAAPHGTVEAVGGFFFNKTFSADEGVGPLFNAQSCNACHGEPNPGGMSATIFDSFFNNKNGSAQIARFHSVNELPQHCDHCGLDTGVPNNATLTSVRSSMSLRSTSLIDFVQPQAIVANQAAEPVGVQGRVATLSDGRIGRFGWKANTATLVEFMGGAFRNEMGLTNGLQRKDLQSGCESNKDNPELDAVPLNGTAAFLSTVDAPAPTACQSMAGAATFASTGCASCHKASFPGPGVVTAWLYSDLLLHDMGPGLADGMVQGAATGSEFRTMTLTAMSERSHFLHDGRAATVSAAITAHGGQGAASATAFSALAPADKQALLDFVGCL